MSPTGVQGRGGVPELCGCVGVGFQIRLCAAPRACQGKALTSETLSHPGGRTPHIEPGIDRELLLACVVDSFVATAVWLFEPDGRIAWCTRRCATALGFSAPEKLLGKFPHDMLPAGWAAEREALIERSFAERRELVLLSIIGGRRMRLRFHPVCMTTGGSDPTHVLGVVEPIDTEEMLRLVGSDRDGSVVFSRVHDLGVLDPLSPRELEVMAMLGRGMRSKEIAHALHRSTSTIEGHRERIGAKLGINDRAELMSLARRAALRVEDADGERVRIYPANPTR